MACDPRRPTKYHTPPRQPLSREELNMAIIAEVSWDQFVDGHFPQSENPARKAFRQAVEEVAQKCREVFPAESEGRILKACRLVLLGDVELLENGTKARVSSQSNGT